MAELAVTLLVVFYRLTHHENVLGTIKNEGHNLWFIAALVPVMVAGFFSLDLMIVLLAFADMTIILPQVVEVFKVKDLSGSNLLTWWLFVGEACLGIFYAFAIGEPLSYAWAYLYLPCYFIIIWKIVSYKRVLRLAV